MKIDVCRTKMSDHAVAENLTFKTLSENIILKLDNEYMAS